MDMLITVLRTTVIIVMACFFRGVLTTFGPLAALLFVAICLFAIYEIGEFGDKTRMDSEKMRQRKVVQEMYAAGKTDADVAKYLDTLFQSGRFFAGKDLAGKDLVCICYNPYFNKNCEEYVKWIANKEKIQEAYEWRNKIRKMYPQAYQSYSEYNHKEASEFRIRLKEYDKNRRAQANSQTYRGPSSNSIDWEKAATGTAIFGPTGAALGMMDDEDKH